MSIALITGASSGIGFATARALAKSGVCVILSGRDAEKLEGAVAELRAESLDVAAVPLDVTSSDSVSRAAAVVAEEFGRLDILVNNAGILPESRDSGEHAFVGREVLAETFATNLFGAVGVIEEFLPLVRESPLGRIVNVSTAMGSLAAQADPSSPYYGVVVPAYQSSKAALNSVTISLSKTLADTPIVVSSVCPGFVQTDLTPANRDQASLTADEAAQIVVQAATLPDGARSGTFFDRAGALPW